MADTSLQDRLREHAMAFDGLLSLIPAKMYYGEDTSDQWKKKKQSKEEARAAKKGKLDPDSKLNRNAKEVLDERARNKRKLRDLEADEDSSVADEDGDDVEIPGVEREKPGEGLKKRDMASEVESAPKKQKLVEDATKEPSANKTPKKSKSTENATEGLAENKIPSKEEKKLAKKLLNEEKKKAKAEKSASKSAAADVSETESRVAGKNFTRKPRPVQPSTGVEDLDVDDMAPIDVSGLVANEDEGASAESATGSTPQSPIFDSNPDATNTSVEVASTTTSISSTITPSEKPKYLKLPADISGLRARLDAKIEALRAARKATDADGTPIRTREELIESRRKKQAQRREHKQELRRAAKEEEDRKREEALTSSRNSPNSMLSPLFEQDDKTSANHFAFGRLAFADGTQLSHDLSYEKPAGTGAKKKGPSDPKTALLKFEAQKKRIEALNDDKRKEVLEKETWLAARRRAEGEKVHDDEGLLKKALKRKETAKRKSEREWSERAKGVEDAIKSKQHKREQNIRKRREDKMSSGKGKKKGVATKKKSRPGFEGSFGGKKK